MWQVLLCVIFALGMVCYSVFLTDYGDAHMPMILAAAFTSAIAALNGWKWSVMEKRHAGRYQSCYAGQPDFVDSRYAGIYVESSRIIPSMIYYGLEILSPSIFLVTAALLCSIVSLAIGSSYTVAGTIGVAMIGIAIGLGVNPAMAAGAVVSELISATKCLRCPTPQIWLLPCPVPTSSITSVIWCGRLRRRISFHRGHVHSGHGT